MLQEFNDIATTHPEIADEWDYSKNGSLRPEQFSIGADIKIWWKCGFEHSWQAVLYSRTNCGCPVCARNILTVGVNDLQTVNPALAAEWDFEKNRNLRPEDVTAFSHKKAWWRCEKGHSWETAVYHRHIGHGCPYCCGLLAIPGETDIGTINPVLLSEWDFERNDGISPDEIKQYSNKKVWWKCKNEHHWLSTVGARNAGSGCPYCLGKIQMRTRLVR